MNLHGIAVGAISAVNPQINASIRVSTGYSTQPDGTQVPSYADPIVVPAQVQSLTFGDLRQVDALNLNGTKRAIYLFGQYDGVVRPRIKGGDLVDIAAPLPNSGAWLVAMVLEQWASWCKVAVVLQND